MRADWEEVWSDVAVAVRDAKAIAWDTCHKIYVLMDDGQVNLMVEYGYDPIIRSTEQTPEEMVDTLKQWYNESCGLQFIQAVRTVEGDANDGFDSLIPQGIFWDDEEDY